MNIIHIYFYVKLIESYFIIIMDVICWCTYWPEGWMTWIRETGMKNEQLMPQDVFEENISDEKAKLRILALKKRYDSCEQEIKTDRKKFINGMQKKYNIEGSMVIYDHLISKIFCDFWKELIEQPRETIKSYYKQHVPKIEETFYNIEEKYDLHNDYPASVAIAMYKELFYVDILNLLSSEI